MKRLATLSAVLVVLLLGWWIWSSQAPAVTPDVPTSPLPAAASPDTATAATATPVATDAAPTVDATAQRTSAPTADTAEAIGPECVLRGRCVDAAGKPIADVTASLLGWGANSGRIAAWNKDHEEPKRIEPKTTTGADGVFVFRFWPPPPFQFALDLDHPGLASMSGRWSELAPGSTKDLGDIAMLPGTRVRGRIVDSNGVPATNVQVYFNGKQRGSEEKVGPADNDSARVRTADGTFRGHSLLPAGTYELDVRERTVVSPKQLELDGSVAEQFVEVVIEALDDSKAIKGVVVDEQGAPIRGVQVGASPPPTGQHWIISTDKDGQFRVQQSAQDAPSAVRLSFDHHNFETTTTNEAIAWGRTDVRITMVRRPSIDVLVVDGRDGKPVEDYQLRVLWAGNSRMVSSSDTDIRDGNHHDGGRLHLQGVTQGKHLLLVEPRDPTLAFGRQEIDVPMATSAEIVVRLPLVGRRELRVQRADGTPVANVPVQFADASMREPQARETDAGHAMPVRIMAADQWAWNSGHCALELLSGTTDAEGKFVLRGPGDHELLLRLPGPPNVPIEVADVRLDVAEPLFVTIGAGARLQCRVVPPEAAVELFRLGGVTAGDNSPSNTSARPVLHLSRQDGSGRFPPDDRPATIADDGTFALDGVPPGPWTVQLEWSIAIDSGRMGTSQNCGSVTLQEGATTKFDIDASFILPGDLEGLAIHNGAPFGDAQLTLVGSYGKDEQGNSREQWIPIKTDAKGRFIARVRAGDYRAMWWSNVETMERTPAAERATVVVGRTTTQTFHFETGTARLRLVDATGAATARVALFVRDATGTPYGRLPDTDADGRTQMNAAAGAYTIVVLPKRLQDPLAQQELWRNRVGDSDPLAPMWIHLADVQITVGESREIELRLPADW